MYSGIIGQPKMLPAKKLTAVALPSPVQQDDMDFNTEDDYASTPYGFQKEEAISAEKEGDFTPPASKTEAPPGSVWWYKEMLSYNIQMDAPVIVCYGLLTSDVANSYAVPAKEIGDFLKHKGKAYEAFVAKQEKCRADYDAQFVKLKAENPATKYNTHDWKHGGFEFYERTQPAPYDGNDNAFRTNFNRVYVDIDGKAGAMNQKDFNELDETIQQTIHFAVPFGHSMMTASQWNKSGQSKLSYRITLLKHHGSKTAISKFVEDKIYKVLKEALADFVPLEMKTAKNKKQLQEDKFEEQNTYLLIDNGVYNPVGRKMRMLGQTKPNENRPNKWGTLDEDGEPDVLHSLITYIPDDSEAIDEPEPEVEVAKPKAKKRLDAEDDEDKSDKSSEKTADPTDTPTIGKKPLLVRVAEALGEHRWNNYDDFITSGFICFNEDLGLELWERLAKQSPKNKPGDCAKHWQGFKKGRLTQERWWAWLRTDNPLAYIELIKERNTFWDLIKNPNHAELAQFFWNTKPDGYVYNETLKWFQLLPTNAWKQYNNAPSGLMTDIWKTLKAVAKDHEPMAKGGDDDWKSKALKSFIMSIGNATLINGVIQFLPTCYNDDDLVQKMDENRDVFAFLDKVYDIKEKVMRDIRPTDWVCLNAGYTAPKASDPKVRADIEKMLMSMWENQTIVDYVKRTIGSCISGTRRFEEFYIWTGKGGNGKGVLSALIQKAFGRYFHTFSHTMLTKSIDKKDAPNPALAQAKGKRFSQGTEPETNDKLQEGFVKLLSGNDQVEARELYGNPVRFVPQCGWWLQCNDIPKFNKVSGGAKRRVKVLKFPFQFVEKPTSDHERPIDSSLKEKINKSDAWRDEFILMMIDAYETIGESMNAPEEVYEATSNYINTSNPCYDWIMENFNIVADKANKETAIASEELFEMFKAEKGGDTTTDKFKAGMELIGIPFKRIGSKFNGKVLDMTKSYVDADGKEKRVMTATMERKSGNYWWGLERKLKPLEVPVCELTEDNANEEQKGAVNAIQRMMKR